MKIRIGNDFRYNWLILWNEEAESFTNATDKRLTVTVYGRVTELLEGTDYTITGNTIAIDFTPAICDKTGSYNLALQYTKPSDKFIDGDRRSAVDVDAFIIVPKSEQSDSLEDITHTSDAVATFLDVAYQKLDEIEAAEVVRETAEEGRVTAETGRGTAEGLRATAETSREGAETGRVTAEGLRVTAETGRAAAEVLREANIQDAIDAADYANEKGAYAEEMSAHPPVIIADYWHNWNFVSNQYETTGQYARGDSAVEGALVVQETGQSAVNTMSQKAVTDELVQLAGDVNDITDRVVKNESILDIQKSWNLYDKSNAVDRKLASNNPAVSVSTYENAAYSGLAAVDGGKTYVISQTLRPVGVIYCFDNNVTPPSFNVGAICSVPTVGTWGDPTGKITRTDIPLSNGFYATIIEVIDPSIQYITWAMHGYSYWTHTTEQFEQLIDTAQVENGSVRSDYTTYGWETITVKESALQYEQENYETILYKNGSKIYSRIRFDESNDLCHVWEYPITVGNKGLNLSGMLIFDKNTPHNKVGATSFKTSGDDIAPIAANTSYVGANHGYYDLLVVTANAHGKTSADIGSVWNLSLNKNFIIVDVVDANTLKIFSDYTGNQISPVSYTSAVSFSGTLTHVSNATNTSDIPFSATVKEQLYPNTNNKSIRLVLDGSEVITDGIYYGRKFDLIESYNITDIPSIQSRLKDSIGEKLDLSDNTIDGWIRVNNIFSHGRNGSLTIHTSYEFLKQTSIGSYGAIQSMSIGDKVYIPNVGIVDGKNMSDVTTQGAATLDFIKSSWLDASKPPYRYHQFNDDMSKGIALGYNTAFGITSPSIRSENATAGNINGASKKMYPYAKSGGSAAPGDYHEVVSFRVPMRVIDTDATCLYWYWVGEDIYLAFDFHKNVDKLISLPLYMSGLRVEEIDVHPNTTIQSEFVSSGIKVKVINGYGYGVVRLFK